MEIVIVFLIVSLIFTTAKLVSSKKEMTKSDVLIEKFTQFGKISKIGSFELNVDNNEFWVSKQTLEILNLKELENEKLSFNNFINKIHPKDLNYFLITIQKAINSKSEFDIEVKFLKKAKESIVVNIKGGFYSKKLFGVIKDITKYKKVNFFDEELNKLIGENIENCIVNSRGDILSLSSALDNLTLLNELKDRHYSYLFYEENSILIEEIDRVLLSNLSWSGEVKIKKGDDSFFWASLNITPINDLFGKVYGFLFIIKNITNTKKLEKIANIDEMTELYNRRYFNTIIPSEIRRILRERGSITFILLDVDCFKQYNDTYGHVEGDEALKSVARVMRENFNRANDFYFRLGGEEFGIFTSNISYENSIKVAQNLCNRVEDLKVEHKNNRANSKFLTISIGLVYIKLSEFISKEKIVDYADKELYKSKENGRNQVNSLKIGE